MVYAVIISVACVQIGKAFHHRNPLMASTGNALAWAQFLAAILDAKESMKDMALEFLFWIYLINAILLINHEIDSAFWREWELFKLPGGTSGFLALHFPILFLVLYGLVSIERPFRNIPRHAV